MGQAWKWVWRFLFFFFYKFTFQSKVITSRLDTSNMKSLPRFTTSYGMWPNLHEFCFIKNVIDSNSDIPQALAESVSGNFYDASCSWRNISCMGMCNDILILSNRGVTVLAASGDEGVSEGIAGQYKIWSNLKSKFQPVALDWLQSGLLRFLRVFVHIVSEGRVKLCTCTGFFFFAQFLRAFNFSRCFHRLDWRQVSLSELLRAFQLTGFPSCGSFRSCKS